MRVDGLARSRRETFVLGLTTALGGGGVIAAGAAVGTAIGSVHHVTVGAGRLALAGRVFSYPTLNTAAALMLALAALGAVTLIAAVRAIWRQGREYRRFLQRAEILGPLDGHPAVTVIAGSRPEAFCAGYLRPAVYVSEAALSVLSPTELDAVLAHEYHHRRARDPLRLALGRILAQAVFFVPVLRPLRDRYSDLAELRADRAAVGASGGRRSPLASALLTFDACSPPGSGGVSPARVDSLLGEPDRWRVSYRLMIGSISVLVAAAILIWRTSAGASAHATFDVPLLTTTPCLSMLMLVPMIVCAGLLRRRTRITA